MELAPSYHAAEEKETLNDSHSPSTVDVTFASMTRRKQSMDRDVMVDFENPRHLSRPAISGAPSQTGLTLGALDDDSDLKARTRGHLTRA